MRLVQTIYNFNWKRINEKSALLFLLIPVTSFSSLLIQKD